MIQVIALTGQAGCGKSTVARMLVNEFGAVPIGLADYFKIPAVVHEHLPLAEVFGPLDKSATTRHFLQQRGTEEGRDRHGDDVWVRHLDAHLYRLHQMGVRRVVVDDVRFTNEATYVLRKLDGEVWRVTGRGGLHGEAATHRSEAELDRVPVTEVLANHSTHAALWDQVQAKATAFWGPRISLLSGVL